MQIAVGTVVAGKYQLEAPLAQGGMGTVWVAHHVKLTSRLAVKFLDPRFAAAPAFVERFEREARAAASLQSPNVVHVQDYGIEDGTPYLVMELLQGEDLGGRLARLGRLSPPEVARILVQVGKALRKAHDAGVVHRDLKPANLFLTRVDDDEVVKVLDFGIAKETAAALGDATKTGELLGSPHYMSPEQARADKGVDLRADLWSVGVILYRATTGVLPFPGDVLGAVLSRILVDPVPPVATVAPDLPAAFDTFFAKAMAKSKEARFQSVRELVDAFVQIAGGVPMSSSGHISLGTSTPGIQTPFAAGGAGATNPFPIVGATPAPLVGTGPGTLTAASTSADRTPKPKRSALPWIAVAVLVLLAAGGGLFGWNRMQSANAGSAASGSSPAPDAKVPAPVVTVPGTASSTPEPTASGSASTPPESPTATTGSSAAPPKGSGRLPPRPVGTKKAGDGWGF